jgi:hypothetical protein
MFLQRLAPNARLELGLGAVAIRRSLQKKEYLKRFAWFEAPTAK